MKWTTFSAQLFRDHAVVATTGAVKLGWLWPEILASGLIVVESTGNDHTIDYPHQVALVTLPASEMSNIACRSLAT